MRIKDGILLPGIPRLVCSSVEQEIINWSFYTVINSRSHTAKKTKFPKCPDPNNIFQFRPV